MAKKETIELQLPREQIEYIRAVAKLAGVSENSAFSVMLAIQALRWPEQRARVPDAWRETIQEAIDCIADVERFKGNLKIGVYRHIGEKLNTLLAAAPSQPEEPPHA